MGGVGENPDNYSRGGTKLSDTDLKIIQIVKNAARPLSKRKIAEQLKLSPATTGKYVDILIAKGILNNESYGNIHLISLRVGKEGDDQ